MHFHRVSKPQHCWLLRLVGRCPAVSASPVALHWMEGERRTAASGVGTAHPRSISSFSWGNRLWSGSRGAELELCFCSASRVATAGGHRFAQTTARRLKIKTIFIY